MNVLLRTETEFFVETCISCGVLYGVPMELHNSHKRSKVFFFCPNGHQQQYSFSEADKLRDELVRVQAEADRRKADADYQRERAERLERSVSAQKAVTTRLKNKAAKGHCPCCDRLFPDLASHMATEHPEFEAADSVENVPEVVDPPAAT